MLESQRSKEIIAYRRSVRRLTKDGYTVVPSHWYGPDYKERIVDVQIVDGRALYIKTEPR